MLKILLTFLFLIIFLIPKSEVFAQATAACKTGTTAVCPPGSTPLGEVCSSLATVDTVNPASCSDGSAPEAVTNPPAPPRNNSALDLKACPFPAVPTCPGGSFRQGQACANAMTGDPVIPEKCTDAAGAVTDPTADAANTPALDCSLAANRGMCTSGAGKSCDTASGAVVDNGDGILSAIGCIPTEPRTLVNGLIKYGTLAAGGIAFLLMLLGALQMITAEGNPESIKHGQERFYSAIIGLLLVIFSVLLMQVIGVDILGLPGFGKQ